MSEHDFCLWLQGFAELNPQPPTPEQWQSIREHLQTVYSESTTSYVCTYESMQQAQDIQPIDIGSPSYGAGIIC